ncbi:hypothetical protein NGM10_10510 [Halorussus salilacus]|uniref:hypothetical protein n=1 Tax=Halorussus salilacus TaxID=2953750 RepID=UPI0020A0E977|nr:hypothetical protein [Halorussus salilacus]USZ67162.1 hypothetical protein NGM10_10510 [Halorussus salilacus]
MKNCAICGKPTKSHVEHETAICHSCYQEHPAKARSMLAQAKGEEEENEDILDSVPTMETDNAFYADISEYFSSVEPTDIDGPNVEELIDELLALLSESDTKKLVVSLMENYVGSAMISDDPDFQGDTVGIPPKMIEYLLGLISTTDVSSNGEIEYEEIQDKSEELIFAYLFRDFPSSPKDLSETERTKQTLKHQLLGRELASGRFVYAGQYLEAAKRAYSPHNRIFQQELGFTIDDAIRFSRELIKIFSMRVKSMMEQMAEFSKKARIGHGQFLLFLEEHGEDEEAISNYWNSEQFRESQEIVGRSYEKYLARRRELWISEEKLSEHFQSEEFDCFLNRMTTTIGAQKDFRYPYKHNPIHESPILETDGEYIIPHFKAFYRAIAETFYYDLRNIDDYEFGNEWGEYVEEWAYESIQRLFPESEVLLNPKYEINGEDGESDIVVFHKNKCLVIECKTQGLTLPTRAGDYEETRKNVMRGIGNARDQATKLIEGIKNNTVTEFQVSGEETRISPGKYDEFESMVILREQYDWIATTEYNRITDFEDNIPYVLSVYDLQVISECFKSPDDFFQFVSKRVRLLEGQTLASPDELDYVGAYLSNGLEVVRFADDDDIRVFTDSFAHEVYQIVGDRFYPDELKVELNPDGNGL